MKLIIENLWPLLKPYKGTLFLLLLLGLVLSALKGLTPELTRQLIDNWREKDAHQNVIIPVTIAGLWFVISALRFIHAYNIRVVSEKTIAKLRKDLMSKYLNFDLGYMQNLETGTGGLIYRLTNELLYVQFGIQKLTDMLKEPFSAIIMFGYLLYIDWKLTLFIIATFPIVGVGISSISKSIRKYSGKNFNDLENISKTLKESLDGSRIVRSFNLQSELEGRFEKQVDQYIENRKMIIRREETSGPLTESIGAVGFAGLLVYIGNQIVDGNLSVADFMGFSFAIAILQDSVKRCQQAFVTLQQGVVSLIRYNEMMTLDNKIMEPETPQEFPDNWKTIEFRNVSFSYEPGKPILQNFSLKVNRGESIAFVGSSGSGKSTAVNLLQRFFDPEEGEILIDGIDIKSFLLKDLRQNISLVSQDVFLFDDSVAYNIQSGNLERTSGNIEEAAKLANADTFIKAKPKAYDCLVGESGSMFSGGEKQRISIARAIYKDAPILVLDEATSALDSESEREVQKGIAHLMEGRTSFVIAHRLSTIYDADRIVVMSKGRILEMGTHQELLEKQGDYYQLHSLQN